MKIILIEPPNFQRSGTWEKQKVYRTPTNLAILAAYARQRGYNDIKIFDFDVHGGPAKALAEKIISEKPDIVGFTCLTPRFPAILAIASFVKQAAPQAVIVIGGPHVNGVKEKILNDAAIDFGMIGEAETAFVELLDSIKSKSGLGGVHNLIYRTEGKVRINPVFPAIQDLDSLPFPAWDLLDLNDYTDQALYNGPHAGIMSGRGCPYSCIFCASKVTWGQKVRLRSAENVVGEIVELIGKFGISEYMFYDDTFTINRKRAADICRLIIEKNLKIRFYLQSRADTIDLELAQLLKTAGCIGVAIGVESGDEIILKQIGKCETKDQFRKAVKIFKEVGLPCVASYIIGLPGDTHETIKATIDFANELDTDQAKFMIATPYPGTALYDMAVERNLLKSDSIEDLGDYTYYQHVAANLSFVKDEELVAYQRSAYDEYDKRKRSLR